MRDTLELPLIKATDGRLWRQATDPDDTKRAPAVRP